MKRIASSLIIVFLTCQVSYAVCPYERLMQRVENRQELTQEDVDETLDELIDFIETEDIGSNTSGCDLLYAIIASQIIAEMLNQNMTNLLSAFFYILLALIFC